MLSQALNAHTGPASMATHAKPVMETTQPLNVLAYLESALPLKPKKTLARPANSSSKAVNDCFLLHNYLL